MPEFVLTRKAKADLLSIGRYTAEKWGREQRNRYLTMLDQTFRELAANPMKGRDCATIRPDYRKQSAGRHVIFYRLLGDSGIEIVRVLHERMDVARHLSSPDAD